jgi:hypothetical protein
MSLTSYRAAPPRAERLIWAPRTSPDLIRGPGGGGRPSAPGRPPGLTPVMSHRALPPRRRWGRLPGDGGGWGLREPGGDLLFRVFRRSTIGAEGFHGRVRDGIGCLAPRCDHQAVAAPGDWRPRGLARRGIGAPGEFANVTGEVSWGRARRLQRWLVARGVIPRVWRLGLALAAARRRFSGQALILVWGSSGFERLVPVSSTDCSASTSGLSTWWSSTALDETWF